MLSVKRGQKGERKWKPEKGKKVRKEGKRHENIESENRNLVKMGHFRKKRWRRRNRTYTGKPKKREIREKYCHYMVKWKAQEKNWGNWITDLQKIYNLLWKINLRLEYFTPCLQGKILFAHIGLFRVAHFLGGITLQSQNFVSILLFLKNLH